MMMETLISPGYAEVNGINMYYEVHGEGTIPLILIHGGGSTIQSSFSTIVPSLAAHGKVIAVELQAHGRTTDRDAPASFEQDADDVVALLHYLKINIANFLGFSNGGTTTLQIAIRHPHVVNKMVVISGAYKREGFITGFFDSMQTTTLDSMPMPLQTAFLKVTPDKNLLQIMFNKDRQRMIDFKDTPDAAMESIKAPALFITGDQDVVTVDHTLKMSRLLSNAQLVVLPGIHGACIGEICTYEKGSSIPGMTTALIEKFLHG